MAARARLTAPQFSRVDWPWHVVRSATMPSSLIGVGDRRFEAQNYIASGFGIRLAIQNKVNGWAPLSRLAQNLQPPRLKGIVVAPEYGLPYLSATQVFDLRPVARKFLSLDKVKRADQLSATSGDILVTRSGTVGRVTLAHVLHENKIISDDLIRVVPGNRRNYGWVYAYLRSSLVRQMMTSIHYGHMIKHLETSHLDALPIPQVSDDVATKFNDRVDEVLKRRNLSYQQLFDAERMFEVATGEDPCLKMRQDLRLTRPMLFAAAGVASKQRSTPHQYARFYLISKLEVSNVTRFGRLQSEFGG